MIFLMKKTILQYMTDIYQEDIPKHILQENKIRLNSFFLEQESVQKKGTQFIFRYAFYSVEKPRKITKQHLLKEYAGVPLEKRSVQPEQIPDMKQYSDIILYGDASSPEAQQQLAEYLQQHNSLKVQLSFLTREMIPLARMNKPSHMRNYRRRYFLPKKKDTSPVRFLKRDDRRHPFSQSAGGEPCRFQMYRFSMVLQGESASDKGSCAI